ncbi:MAG: hypothetical protein JWR16_841 [Nevskia sp.]|nr:hypothetical protein [Nevskia sp.]
MGLAPGEQAEALQALAAINRAGIALEDINPSNFVLPQLAARLDALIDDIEGGRGFALLAGVPIEGLSAADLERLFWGLACHIGYPEPQDAGGKRLHHVQAEFTFKDEASATRHFAASTTRGYQTNIELDFHGDGSDVLFFLCHRQGKTGGSNKLASATTAFNEILAARPDLALELQQPYAFDARGELGPDRPFQLAPIFSYYRRFLNILYKRGYIDLAQQLPGAPQMTAAMREAIDLLDQTIRAERNAYSFMLQPGDILIANNYSILHARTVFEDHDEPALKRHMLRIWSTLRRKRRPLPPALAQAREFQASARRRIALGDAA